MGRTRTSGRGSSCGRMHVALLVTHRTSGSTAHQGRHLGYYKCRFPTQGRDGLESSLWLTPNYVRPFWPPCFSLQPTKTPSSPSRHFLSPFPSIPCCSHLIPKDSVPSAPDIQCASQGFCCFLKSSPFLPQLSSVSLHS